MKDVYFISLTFTLLNHLSVLANFNPKAYKGEGGVDATPTGFSLNFSETNYHLDLPFSVAVRISLKHILTQIWRELVAMVTRYDVIGSRWSSHF